MARQVVRVQTAIASFLSHAAAVSSHAVRPLVLAGTLAACVGTAALSLAAEGKPPRAEGAAVTINAGSDWVPLDVDLDIEPGSALDFSNVLPRHAPAGKFGRLIATKQGKFAFEHRAVPMRFYGVDLCCTAQFLSRELADRLAERLVTKLRYADDPALASLSLMNEDCPGNFMGGLQGRLRDDWQSAWNRWLAARYPDRQALAAAIENLSDTQDPARGTVPLPSIRGQGPDVITFHAFVADLQWRFFDRTRTFLRDEMRCQALLTDCNGWTHPVQLQAVRSRFDYVDDHFYVDHPQYLSPLRLPPSRSGNANAVAGGGLGCRDSAFSRLLDKPFTITEFNYCGPGQYRGVGGLMTGALAALQDWDGLWRHVYSYNRENISRPAAMCYFDVAADPLTQAAECAGLCLFLRGDLQPAKHSVAITSTPEALLASAAVSRDRAPAWNRLAWLTRVGWRIGDPSPTTDDDLPLVFSGETDLLAASNEKTILDRFAQSGWLPAANRTDLNKNFIQSENGEVTIDVPASTLTVDTACTAGGFAPAGKRIETRAATIDILDTCTTVWVSSLDGAPIARSQRLLITHLTDLQNTGTQYADRNRQLLLDWGRLPHLVRAGRATVVLRIEHAERARVYSLAVNGKRTGEVQTSVAEGVMSVPLSVSANGKARLLYEIEVQPNASTD